MLYAILIVVGVSTVDNKTASPPQALTVYGAERCRQMAPDIARRMDASAREKGVSVRYRAFCADMDRSTANGVVANLQDLLGGAR